MLSSLTQFDPLELLFTTEGIENYISGIILFEETLFQNDEKGTTLLVSIIQKKGIIPGIKVDLGVKPIGTSGEETVTQGLDNLDSRCARFYSAGARFAKWRGVINVNPNASPSVPSDLAIEENARALARFASICQANRLVPVIEPEVLMDNDFSIKTAETITSRVLAAVYKALNDQNVFLEGTLLKPNMVRSGAAALIQAPFEEVASASLRVLQQTGN